MCKASLRSDAAGVRVGGPTIKAIIANKIWPRLLDRYLARHEYRGQLSSEAANPSAPDNLFEPMAGDHGAHGRFDRRSTPRRALGLDAQNFSS